MLGRCITVLLVCSLVSTGLCILFSMELYNAPSRAYNPNHKKSVTEMCKNCTETLRLVESVDETVQPSPQVSWDNTYMALKVKARLGNQLFAYAALRQFSSLKNSTPIIHPDYDDIARIFTIRVAPYINMDCSNFTELPEMRRDLEGTLAQIDELQPANVSFVGFYQSPKFFENICHEIREEYTFRDHISDEAWRYLRSVVPEQWINREYIQVAIHIRRTDHVSYKFIEQLGFNFPPESYFRLAMEYFTRNYSLVQFIVASDDLPWCRTLFSSCNEHIVFSENHTSAVDLAIMSYCEHAIITIGTFSWWVGWLSRGTTIYYANYNRRPSWVSAVLNPSHYIPNDENNNWIPIRHKDDKNKFKRQLLTEAEWEASTRNTV